MNRRSPRTLLAPVVLAWALALAGSAAAWAPVGTELLLTDVAARALVGYGVRQDDRLVLQVSVDRAALRVLVAVPGADARTIVGEIADGRVWLFEQGSWRDLAALLAADGLGLVLRRPDGREVVVAPAPGSRPPGATAPEDAAGAAPPGGGSGPGSEDDDADDDDRDDDDRDDDDRDDDDRDDDREDDEDDDADDDPEDDADDDADEDDGDDD